MRWYNPKLEDFEWREVPESDEEALSLLEGSLFTPTCTWTYREWRELGAGLMASLIRAGEAARELPDAYQDLQRRRPRDRPPWRPA